MPSKRRPGAASRRCGQRLDPNGPPGIALVGEERMEAKEGRDDAVGPAPVAVLLPELLRRRRGPGRDRPAVAVGRRDVEAVAGREVADDQREGDVAISAGEMQEHRSADLEDARSPGTRKQVGVRAAEPGEQLVPGGRLDLDEPAHWLEARFLARSMLSVSSMGSGSGRKASPSVRRMILASSQRDQLSMYQRSSSNRSGHEIESRPCTWAQPVIPGGTLSRRRSVSV